MKTTKPTRVMKITDLLALAVALLLTPSGDAQTIVNPDFSMPALPDGTFYEYNPPTGPDQPWTFAGQSGIAKYNAAGFCTFLVADVDYPGQYAYIQHYGSASGSISQSVSFSSPGTFTISFLEAGRTRCSGGDLNYTVKINPSGGGMSVLSVTNASASSQPFRVRRHRFAITTPGDYILGFESLSHNGGSDNTVMIDNVSLGLPDDDLLATIHVSAVDICWAGQTNQMYQVQYRPNLSDTNWFAVGSPVLGTGTNCVTDGITGKQQRFYRITRVP